MLILSNSLENNLFAINTIFEQVIGHTNFQYCSFILVNLFCGCLAPPLNIYLSKEKKKPEY